MVSVVVDEYGSLLYMAGHPFGEPSCGHTNIILGTSQFLAFVVVYHMVLFQGILFFCRAILQDQIGSYLVFVNR